MKIKTKIRLGLMFLLAIIMTLAVTGSIYVNRLADLSSAISKDNYESIDYTRNMIQALDEGDDAYSVKKFEDNLVKEEHNITEIGEKAATKEMREVFELYKTGQRDEKTEQLLRRKILQVQDLNMQAIVRKNQSATLAAKQVFAYITILGTLSFLLSFTFVINFPGMIANPIAELTAGIKEIANGNYSSRLNFNANDEFGEVANAFNEMAKKLDEYQNSNLSRLMFEKKRIETIINNMRDAIIGIDEKNKVLFANTVAIQLLGIHDKDLIGKYAPDVALRNDLLRNLLVKEEDEKLLKIFADNKESYFTKDVLQINNGDEAIGQVIVLRNITKYQELDLAKTNFLATVSHELKTPISAIKLGTQLLKNEKGGALNTEQKQLVDGINDDAERLLKITGELLNMTQIETGNIQLSLGKVDAERIVQLATDAVSSIAEQKHVRLKVNLAPKLPAVKADLDKTVWVMVNLLTNAIRYSPENADVDIDVHSEKGMVHFSIKDNGQGIDEKYVSRVFERYFKVPGSKGGTGLGLAISKEFIEAQGGHIEVSSKPAAVTTFTFNLSVG